MPAAPDAYLYPEIEPYASGMLDVQRPHRLYFEQCGNPNGIPVIFLHGGPGSGCAPGHRRFFNPDVYRIVLLDQRGAGRSRPAGCLENNDTHALLEDLERLRAELRIERWLLYGGSWGATLALLYGQQQPRRVLALVLRGAFLARHRDLVWFYGADGVGRLFPREYESFINHLAPSERHEPVAAYNRLLTAPEPSVRLAAARQWGAWEGRVVRQFLPPEKEDKPPDVDEVQRRASIVNHYAHHDFFLGGDGVPLHWEARQHTPCVMVHGQRDLVCPLEAAWTLHRAWPQSKLVIIETGGHVASEPAVGEALVRVFDEMPARLTG
ncbi:MAG: prolyl aminopeptidase [Gammaproteobacteria bacterium]